MKPKTTPKAKLQFIEVVKAATLYSSGSIRWIIGKTSYACEVKACACPMCGQIAVTALPKPIKRKETDGTTHVCHPALGGCNHGFEDKRERYAY